MQDLIFSVLVSAIILGNPGQLAQANTANTTNILSTENFSLSDRYDVPEVNKIFSDNILLTLNYMDGKIKEGEKVSWDKVEAPAEYKIVIKPGETFAFHDNVLPKYQGKISATTNAHFNSEDGFKSDGWLVGDGVCHLASFMNVAARKAGLLVDAPTRHDFAKIPDVSKELGVSIYYSPNDANSSALQNLYITNTRSKSVAFIFDYKDNALNIKVEEID